MSAPELHARLTSASAVLGDFDREDDGQALTPAERDSWAMRLAAELRSVCTALKGALDMLRDADDVLAEQDSSMALGTGGLSVSVEDAPTVMAALDDAARCGEEEHFPSSPADEQAAAYRELHNRIGGQG